MKKLSYLSVAAAALLLGACSSDDILDGAAGEGAGNSGEAVVTKGYVNLGINLPTVPVTAKADPTFADGDPNEYAVNNAILVILQKTATQSEDQATILAAYDLTNELRPWPTQGTTADQITSHASITAPVPGLTDEENGARYALVMLNADNLFDVTTTNTLVRKTNLDDEDFTTTALTTFADLNAAYALSLSVEANGKGGQKVRDVVGFFMSNAPLYYTTTTAGGGDGADATTTPSLQTLVPIEGSIYGTEEAAAANPAVDVYVERAVSKISLASKSFPEEVEEGTYAGDSVQILEWGLDITNRSFYPVRKLAATGVTDNFNAWIAYESNPTRFYGNTAVDAAVTTPLYRTYWAIDPNYNVYESLDEAKADITESTDLDNLFNLRNLEDDFCGVAAEQAQYCLENTFDINNQNQNQTTRVVFKAIYTPSKFKRGDDYYTIGNGREVYYLNETAHKNGVRWWAGEWLNDGYDDSKLEPAENTVENVVKAMLVTHFSTDLHIVNVDQIEDFTLPTNWKQGANDLTGATISFYTYSYKGSNGETLYTSKSVYEAAAKEAEENMGYVNPYTKSTEKTTLATEQLQQLSAKVGSINLHKGGESYYSAYIRHFNDTEVGTIDMTSFGNSYGIDAGKYLGRYGLVRNNWYQLEVSSVSGPGSADIPGRDPETDDQREYWISMQVNVLSWAVRQQSVDL